jgi:hypothetical protein
VRKEGRLDDEQRVRFAPMRANVAHRILLGGRELETLVEVAPGEQRVELVRCGFVALSGTVTDPSGRALENARVETAGLRVQTAADGNFAFTSLGAGSHRLAARSADGRWVLNEPVELVAAPVHVILRLEPGAKLTGRVLEADGRPATGRIWIQRAGDPRTRFEIELGEAGLFGVPELEDVEWELGHAEVPGSERRARPSQGEVVLRLPERSTDETRETTPAQELPYR